MSCDEIVNEQSLNYTKLYVQKIKIKIHLDP